jgi:hypothetical protein
MGCCGNIEQGGDYFAFDWPNRYRIDPGSGNRADILPVTRWAWVRDEAEVPESPRHSGAVVPGAGTTNTTFGV